jgi:hypothetical protein
MEHDKRATQGQIVHWINSSLMLYEAIEAVWLNPNVFCRERMDRNARSATSSVIVMVIKYRTWLDEPQHKSPEEESNTCVKQTAFLQGAGYHTIS